MEMPFLLPLFSYSRDRCARSGSFASFAFFVSPRSPAVCSRPKEFVTLQSSRP